MPRPGHRPEKQPETYAPTITFSPEEVARMEAVRHKIATGVYTDDTRQHKYRKFVQWLIEHERMGG